MAEKSIMLIHKWRVLNLIWKAYDQLTGIQMQHNSHSDKEHFNIGRLIQQE